MALGRPLEGKTVVVTRPREQAASLVEPLEHLGAEVLLVPTIRIVPRALDDEIVRVIVNDLPDYRLIIFTSVNGVDVFLGYLTELGLPFASLDDAIVAAVGPTTASALEQRGVSCDVVADDFVAEGLLDTLQTRAVAPAGTRVLIPSARLARPVLPDALRARGAIVKVLPVYDTVPEERLESPAERIESADFITFTSASTAQQFVALMEAAGAGRPLAERLSGVALCSIGPATSDTLRELGLPVAVEASEHTAAGLVAAIAATACGFA
ncbi:MAG: uroporphyrinogen-III synthase [Actinobacteria bacterium]|nr:uroporphyrinogen-III synthase [Actinomycetota bacterium]